MVSTMEYAATRTGIFNGYRYTLTCKCYATSSEGTLDYETTSAFKPSIDLIGIYKDSAGTRHHYFVTGSFRVNFSSPWGVVTAMARGRVNGELITEDLFDSYE